MDNVKVEEEEAAAAVVVDWLELPEHLTSHILSKLSCITDFARFGDVCVKWRSILFQEDYTKLLPRQLPLLMIPTPPSLLSQDKNNKKKNKKQNDTTNSCSFYRVTDGKIFNRLLLAMPSNRYVRGSGHGWLITIDADDICYSMQLINPFFYPNTATKVIKLPPLTAHPLLDDPEDLYYIHLRKAVLSPDPISNPKDCIVMAIITEYMKLAFCKPGDKVWTPVIDHLEYVFDDIIYYQDKFYALYQKGFVVICDIENRTTTTYAGPPVTNFISNRKYLVAVDGELWQVQRYFNYEDRVFLSEGFKVFKLRKGEPGTDWVEMKDLDNHVFFLGDNASISISPADFPGCKPNCIYYTHDNVDSYFFTPESRPHDLGVFNLENGSFEKHYPTDAHIQLLPAPVWIEPTLPRFISRSKCVSASM